MGLPGFISRKSEDLALLMKTSLQSLVNLSKAKTAKISTTIFYSSQKLDRFV
jgi:hypothetical protein